MDTKNTGKRIKETMERNGISFLEMEKRTGYSRVTLSRYCNGETKIPLSRLATIANALYVSQEYLLGIGTVHTVEQTNDVLTYNVVGSVRCGYGSAPVENYDGDSVSILKSQIRNYPQDECFVMRAYGESMMPFIEEGDLLLIHKQVECDSGDISLVSVNGEECTLKKIHKGDGFVELIPFNEEFPSVVYRGKALAAIQICGKCFHISREL